MDKMDFSQIPLIYRAEGNANLVVYLPQQKQILRLPKIPIVTAKTTKLSQPTILNSHLPKNRSTSSQSTTTSSENENILDSRDHVAYIVFMEHLLGTEFITKPEVVSISSTERDKINRFCAPFRPAIRLDKEFCGQFGLLFPDAATYFPEHIDSSNIELIPGDTIAIEIKPKQGWMLQDLEQSACSDLFNLKGSTRCRFCCIQFSKLKCRKIKKLSTYCPMDLFSGNLQRMNKAIDGLFQYPQNNLRVFINGVLHYDDELQQKQQQHHQQQQHLQNDLSFDQFSKWLFNGKYEIMKKIIIKCLLKTFNIQSQYYINNDAATELPIDCVLHKVLQLQLLAKKNMKFMTENYFHREHYDDVKVKSYNYLKELIANIDDDDDDEMNLNSLSQREQYMVAATALDCSIMITFKEITSQQEEEIIKLKNSNKIVKIDDRIFYTNTTVIDLDPKLDNHFDKFVMKTNQAYLDASMSS